MCRPCRLMCRPVAIYAGRAPAGQADTPRADFRSTHGVFAGDAVNNEEPRATVHPPPSEGTPNSIDCLTSVTLSATFSACRVRYCWPVLNDLLWDTGEYMLLGLLCLYDLDRSCSSKGSRLWDWRPCGRNSAQSHPSALSILLLGSLPEALLCELSLTRLLNPPKISTPVSPSVLERCSCPEVEAGSTSSFALLGRREAGRNRRQTRDRRFPFAPSSVFLTRSMTANKSYYKCTV
mmetsp:Transcript_23664/g.51650  ORF Transcript_23664/g.51650 Transcript_23664/m.51650 type:complete len:235 (-) Transcript_23664:54-758(-)